MAKIKKYKTSYSKDMETYDFITRCSTSVPGYLFKFHCKVCNVDLSCAAVGMT